MGTLKTGLSACICGVDPKKLESSKFFVGLYVGVAVAALLLILGAITRDPRAFLVLGVLVLITLSQWVWNYRKRLKLGHSKKCARRFAWIASISVGPMY